jgi:hypothetical protein
MEFSNSQTIRAVASRVLGAVLCAYAPVVAHAQALNTSRSVEGRVRHPVKVGGDSTSMAGASGAMVTLHRVGKDTAGPVDSVRADGAGKYRFRFTPFGARDAVYFASVSWGGIAYFTAPLRAENVSGDDAEITVFDTTSRSFPLAVKGRHLIVGKADSANRRPVVEVFELANDSVTTLVAAEAKAAAPTWSVAIPRAAQDVRLTQGEIAADAFVHSEGRVSVFAPIAPGLKQVAFTYKLPVADFPVQVTAVGGAVVFEVLLEESDGSVFGNGFTAVAPVTIEGRTFQRFLAQDVKPGADVTVELKAAPGTGRAFYVAGVLIVIGFVTLLLMSRAMQRRASAQRESLATDSAQRPLTAPRAPSAPLHEQLAQEIAALDATFARQSQPSDAVRAAYDARRRELKDALNEALASVRTG